MHIQKIPMFKYIWNILNFELSKLEIQKESSSVHLTEFEFWIRETLHWIKYGKENIYIGQWS